MTCLALLRAWSFVRRAVSPLIKRRHRAALAPAGYPGAADRAAPAADLATSRPCGVAPTWIYLRGPTDAAALARVADALGAGAERVALDLRESSGFTMQWFEQLADVAARSRLQRLAVVLAFDAWVSLRGAVLLRLASVREAGRAAAIAYAEQAAEVPGWLVGGTLGPGDAAEVVRGLRTRWHPTPLWPAVLKAAAKIAQEHTSSTTCADLLIEISALALSFGGSEAADHALQHARSALLTAGDRPSGARCRVLRAIARACGSRRNDDGTRPA